MTASAGSSRRWAALARPVALVATTAGVVAAVGLVPGRILLDAAAEASPTVTTQGVALQTATLWCPGPETEGLAGVPAVPGGTTTVLAATAPTAALIGTPVADGSGLLTVKSAPEGAVLAQSATRGAVLPAQLVGPITGEVAASGSLAAGLAATQTWKRLDSDERGLVATPCLAPTSEAWLLAGGGDPTRRERLVVANPGGNAVTADVTMYGAGGPVAASATSRLVVPPRGRVVVLLDAIAGVEVSPAVHVVATGGLVTAVVEDSWIDGAVGRGRDDAATSAAPATDQVIPGVVVGGPAMIRVLVPGAAEAVVQARVLTPTGPLALPQGAVTRVPGGSVRDIPIEGLPPGPYAVQLTADQPVTAAVMSQHRPDLAAPSDLAWAASTEPIHGLAGVPTVPGAQNTLILSSTGGVADVTVYLTAGDGAVTTKALRVEADAIATVDAAGAVSVWVATSGKGVRAGLAVALSDPGGSLVSSIGLRSTQLMGVDIPVRERQG